MKTFVINGKTYAAREFDFGLICDLEDLGISMEDIETKPMSFVRAYFMFCSGLNKSAAAKEIQEHMISGGDFEDITGMIADGLENSGFFRALKKETEKKTTTKKKETATK
jgi:hypothetical protein